MSEKTCPTCHGKGTVPDEHAACESTISPNGVEILECWAERPHPGEPHCNLTQHPCPACLGFDEHAPHCPNVEATEERTLYLVWTDHDDGEIYQVSERPPQWYMNQLDRWRAAQGRPAHPWRLMGELPAS